MVTFLFSLTDKIKRIAIIFLYVGVAVWAASYVFFAFFGVISEKVGSPTDINILKLCSDKTLSGLTPSRSWSSHLR